VNPTIRPSTLLRAGVLAAGLVLAGAAPAQSQTAPANPADPLEGFNRAVFGFNEALDAAVLKPLAEGYVKVTPAMVRQGVGNVLGNLSDVWSTVNQFLQGKPDQGVLMGMRVATNTVMGIGGVFDVATEIGLDRRSEDFGQTLGVWGFGPGPYLVLPVLGPSTLRDTAALPVDQVGSPTTLLSEPADRFGLVALTVVNVRADLLGATRLIDDVALDKYGFIRDGHLSRRRNQVYDGNPPEPPPEAPEPAASARP
jgi:phospholipid-binding lipoprotein MlaA